jgi:succinyl-CoA synthetase alpha subunit
MGILANKSTRLIIQGITGREGRFHCERMRRYGTNVVAGVTPGKGGMDIDGIKVFDTVAEAIAATGANASCIFTPPMAGGDSIAEALDAGIELAVCITEGIPTLDVIRALDAAKRSGRPGRLVGPNCPGMLTVGETLIGISPGHIARKGHIGLISRSGTLTYEVINLLSTSGFGQTSCIGVGGDPVIGTDFVDCLKLFEEDPDTYAIVLLGEIGGQDEEAAAGFIKQSVSKPVVSFISGRTAPEGKRMGHAGAIISGGLGSAKSKIEALKEAAVPVADRIADIPMLLGRYPLAR